MFRVSRLAFIALAGVACVKRVDAQPTARQAVRLLAATSERETEQNQALAEHLEADSDQERTPRIVATGETPLLSAEGAEVKLYGDEAGTQGFQVDNGILLEVFADDGRRVARAAVGFLNGLAEGKEQIDLLGRRTFRFEAGEVNLASLLPERGRFRVRATVLDIGGVGWVSDVFLVIEPRAGAAVDELRDR
jgi:hypothetical protein